MRSPQKSKSPFHLDDVAKASSAVRLILKTMEEEVQEARTDAGIFRDSENPQRDQLLTAALRGEIRALERWIARLSQSYYI